MERSAYTLRVPAICIAVLFLLGGSTAASRDGGDHGGEDGTALVARPPADGGEYPMPLPAPELAAPEISPPVATFTPVGQPTGSDPGASNANYRNPAAGNASVPDRMLAAYQRAAATTARERPGCHLSWQLLAAIGKVESGHAADRGVDDAGTLTRPVVGVPLDGGPNRALVRDTDDGRLDGDTTYDRAVGPMQFIPTTWARSGRDGNGDGTKDPQNVHDATLAAAGYLCDHGRDLADPAQLRAAILAYNHSDDYLAAVLAWKNTYDGRPTTTTVALGAPPLPGPPATSAPAPPAAAPAPSPGLTPFPVYPLTPRPTPTPTPTREPTASPGPGPSGPPPSTTPTPTPTPDPCPAVTVNTTTLAATAVDVDPASPGYEAVDVTGVVTATGNSNGNGNVPTATVAASASDAVGPVTSTTTTVTPSAQPRRLARLDGKAVGDTGTAGTLTVVLTVTANDCPPLSATLAVTGLDPAAFAGWTTTPHRLQAVLDDYTTAGQVTTATAATLTALVPAQVTAPGQLAGFLDALAATTTDQVHAEARARLTSHATRLNT